MANQGVLDWLSDLFSGGGGETEATVQAHGTFAKAVQEKASGCTWDDTKAVRSQLPGPKLKVYD
jgi:hypothetical protein